MKLSLGFSPCPNDTFIFDALVNNKIETYGISFEVVLEDVETLNLWALQGKLDITKLSFPAFFQSMEQYILLNSGNALGKGVGPLLISKQDQVYSNSSLAETIASRSVALPGLHTTANLLFSFAFPDALNKRFMIFSEIEEAVASGTCDLGVVIHESRFTYQQKGLSKVMDLGTYWEEKMNIPIPLGGIAAKRATDPLIQAKVDKLIRKSLEYAFSNYPVVSDFVEKHSQALSKEVMRKHIDLYVNNYSLDLGEEGKKAIRTLLTVYNQAKKDDTLQASVPSPLFI